MSSPQDPGRRHKAKIKATKKLAHWRAKKDAAAPKVAAPKPTKS